MRRLIATVLFASFLMSGCDHALFTSKEEQCLKSEALAFNDPDSLKVVANLSDRGFNSATASRPESFWVRYASKNSYGAYVSSNMACKKTERGWVRDTDLESAAVIATLIKSLNMVTQKLKLSNDDLERCRFNEECKLEHRIKNPPQSPDYWEREAKRLAEFIVFDSAGKLSDPISPSAISP